MNSDQDRIMQDLIRTVVRCFYEKHHIVICDILLENVILSDVELCQKMKLLNREFNKLVIKLKEDKLIKSEIKVDVGEDNKQMLRTMYFFNYAEVRNVIKYKIFKMTKILESRVKIKDECFYCHRCEISFTSLEAQASMDNFVFTCIYCKSELDESVANSNQNGIDNRDLMANLERIIELLKKSEEFTIQSLDYFQVLELKREKESKKTENTLENGCLDEKSLEKQGNLPDRSSQITNPLKNDQNAEISDFEFLHNNELNLVKKVHRDPPAITEVKVSVNGELKNLSAITEDDKDNMTEDEYIAYFDAYSKSQ